MPRGSVYGRKNGAESSRRAASPEVEDDEDQEDETQETPEQTQGGSVAGVKPDVRPFAASAQLATQSSGL